MNPMVKPDGKKADAQPDVNAAALKAPRSSANVDENRPAPEVVGTDTLYLGIDLGTSRSAVAANNGTRDMIASVVGWPKDNIAAKVLGQRVVLGEAVLKNRLALDVVWPLADGNLIYSDLSGEDRERARSAALELLIQLRKMGRPTIGQAIYAVIGAPAEATKENKQSIIEIARDAGIDSVMVVSEPFAVAYAVDALEDAIVIDIGAGTIDLCRMSGTLPTPEDQVTVFKAGNFIDEEIAKRVRKKFPDAQFSINMIKTAKERFSAVVDQSERALVTFPVDGVPTELDITDEVHQAVSLIIPELVEGIRKLVSTFDPEFQDRIRSRVYVSGGGSQIYGLRDAIKNGMKKIGGGNVFLVEEPAFSGANGALKLAQEMPVRYWEKLRDL